MAAIYPFTLQQEKQASYLHIELAVVLLHLITFLVFGFMRYPEGMGLPVFGIVIAAVYLLLYFLRKQKKYQFIAHEVPVYFFSGWWFAAGVYWMAFLVLAFSCFATISRHKIQVIFSEEGILYKSFPKRTFEWTAVSNVVLKDGMLTIDFINNKLIQQLVEEVNIDEDAFNLFCSLQLQRANLPAEKACNQPQIS